MGKKILFYVFLLAAFPLVIFLGSCAGGAQPGSGTELQAGGDVGEIASPAEVLARWKEPADNGFSEQNRFHYGRERELNLPYWNVDNHTTDGAKFMPHQWGFDPSRPWCSCAYCTYAFPLDGYSGEPEIWFEWGTPPAEWTDFWVGLPDYERGAWHWLNGPSANPLVLDSLAPYLTAEGHLLLIVMITGTEECTLDWLRVDGNVPPVVELLADPRLGPPGEVFLDADFNSYDGDGEIALYEFDLDGDGSFETNDGTSGRVTTELLTLGDHEVAVRVTDDEGLSETATATITINDWQWELVDYGNTPTMVLDDDDHVHISYCRPDFDVDGGLWYGKRNEQQWTLEQVIDDWVYGCEISIDLDSLGQPWIGYRVSETKTVSVCHLEGALWQTEGVALLNDYPDSFFQLILRIDPDDHPNLVFGGGGFYGDWGSRPFNYWRHDGTQWLQELNDISLDSALSFTLAPSGSPHILFSEDRQLSYLAKPGTSWVREEITTALRMIAIWMGPDNGPHVVCKTNEGLSYYARTATQWIKGPVIAPPPAEDYEYALVAGCCDSVNRPFVCYAIFDPVGMIVPPLDTTLMYATLDGEWLAEEVYRGDLRLTSGATLALDSSGQPHLVLELIPWHGGESIYDSVYHIWRE